MKGHLHRSSKKGDGVAGCAGTFRGLCIPVPQAGPWGRCSQLPLGPVPWQDPHLTAASSLGFLPRMEWQAPSSPVPTEPLGQRGIRSREPFRGCSASRP